jgi:TGF-beta propeptide
MRLLVSLIAVAALLFAPAGRAATAVAFPSADVGLPFWCDWGYDWDERCYRDDGPRLPVGGVDDKVWRSALRFPLAQIPAGAAITSAALRVYHDGTCVAPRRVALRCEGDAYFLDAHRILSADWFDERELELDERASASAELDNATEAQWLSFDLTALVRAWHARVLANEGVLIKLADGQEAFDVSGPYVPSSSFPLSALRPRLIVTYTPARGP